MNKLKLDENQALFSEYFALKYVYFVGIDKPLTMNECNQMLSYRET